MSIIFSMSPDVPTDVLGFLPIIFDADDPRPAREQANDRYAHGGGWDPMPGWTLSLEDDQVRLSYKGDKPYRPLATARLPKSNELLVFFRNSWVMILQRDG